MKILAFSALSISLLLSGSLSAVDTRTANNGQLVMEDVPAIPESIVRDLNRYQNVRSAPFQGFSQNGNEIFITTRFSDVSQIHRVAMPGGARNQLTFFNEPVSGITRQPGTDNIAYSMDAGGSEFSQIYLLNLSTGDSTMLTDGKSRNGGTTWSHSGKEIAFQSTRRNGASNDVWILDPKKPDQAEMVLESPDGTWWGPVDWTRSDEQLLIQQYVSAVDSRVYFVDRNTKRKVMVSGDLENGSVNMAFSLDGKDQGFFLMTNQFSEFNQLAYQPLSGGEMTVITKDIPWNLGGFALSKDGTRAAFTVNEEGYNALYLLDPKTFSYQKVVGLPIGLIGGIEFSEDNSKLGFTLNTAQSPSDSYVLTLKNEPLAYASLERWTFSEVGGMDTAKFVAPELIRFESFDKREIPALVYKPKKKGPHPVIISIHGGPESQFRPSFRGNYQLWIEQLGAAVIAPNVRGSAGYGKEYIMLDNGFKREDSVKDIGALLDWIKTQPDLDESRVAVIGGSYGGYMVLASAVHYSDRLKAAVDIVGISNFVTFLENTQDYRRDLRRVEYGDERDPDMRAHLEKISPNNNVEKINLPMFVVQGQNDPRVPVTEAEQVVKSLREKGKQVWYMNALNEGHGYRKKENRDIYQQAVVVFFQKYL